MLIPLLFVMSYATPSVSQIGVGDHYSCALLDGGDVRCWGASHLASQGDPTQPRSIGFQDVVSMGIGENHACVVRRDGTVWCWGQNRNGELGDGTTVDREVPTRVIGAHGMVEVASGGMHSCSRDSGGGIWCWGHPDTVGRGKIAPKKAHLAAQVKGLPAMSSIHAGDDVSCARSGEDAPWCWGFNTSAVLGSARGPVLVPTEVKALAKATGLTLGYRTVCAQLRSISAPSVRRQRRRRSAWRPGISR
jgi:alpha-tubulin suppressor-like RCC1 family protein